jgi:uncharacterized membrane protein
MSRTVSPVPLFVLAVFVLAVFVLAVFVLLVFVAAVFVAAVLVAPAPTTVANAARPRTRFPSLARPSGKT